MSYCIYLRKSRKDAELERYSEGETLARHKKTLLELAKRKNLSIGEIYEEIVSGESISTRPQMQKLLRDVENNLWDGVLVMELERLARGDTKDQGTVAQAFKLTDTLIITPSKTYNPLNEFDEEYFEFGLFMSRREYKTINRRLQAGRLASIKEGNYIGSAAPYGYDKVRLADHKGFTLAENSESDYVRIAFDLFANKNMTPGKIAEYLNSIGAKSKKGGRLKSESVRDMLRNPIYTGVLRWNWRPCKKSVHDGIISVSRPRQAKESVTLVKGKHPALISEELYYKAQEQFGKNARIQVSKELRNPFAHLMYCRECGTAITFQSARNSHFRLTCQNKFCEVSSSNFEIVETAVLEALRKKLGELKIESENKKNIINEEIKSFRSSVKKIEQELSQLTTQQNKLYDLLEQGIYTQDLFLERQATLHDRKKALQSKLIEVREESPKQINYEDCIHKVSELLELYPSLNAKDKNSMLRSVVKRILYYRPKSDRFNQHDIQIDIELSF